MGVGCRDAKEDVVAIRASIRDECVKSKNSCVISGVSGPTDSPAHEVTICMPSACFDDVQKFGEAFAFLVGAVEQESLGVNDAADRLTFECGESQGDGDQGVDSNEIDDEDFEVDEDDLP